MSSSMSAQNHPLPVPPGQQRTVTQRPRAKSGFSFRSAHSRKSSGSGQKIDLHETHAEKNQQRLHSKADPMMAMTEAEPSAVASGAKTMMAPLRAIQHRDNQGNPIADPDRSNPTRSRWERPLDTIRAFEAAIDGNYSSRKSYMRSDSDNSTNFNRRSSYYGGSQAGDEKSRFPQNSYYGGRPQSQRPDSYIDGRPRPDSYMHPENGQVGNGYQPNRARYPRTASEPRFQNGQGIYQGPGNQPSYETVASGSGSSAADPAGYLTDPSSENSSVDRITTLPSKPSGENYSSSPNNGYRSQHEQYGGNGAQRQGNGYQSQGPPPPPPKQESLPRVPIKLGTSSGNAQPQFEQRPAIGEKRKSWFGKRFSKN